MERKRDLSPSLILIIRKGYPLKLSSYAGSDQDFTWCQDTVEKIAPAIRMIGKAMLCEVQKGLEERRREK